MSLLSKVMSPRLSRGVFNCGLLSTEAGTLARALADGLITVAGKEGVHNLINLTMIPTFFIVIFTTLYTWIGYYSLYWWCGVRWPWSRSLFFLSPTRVCKEKGQQQITAPSRLCKDMTGDTKVECALWFSVGRFLMIPKWRMATHHLKFLWPKELPSNDKIVLPPRPDTPRATCIFS